MSALRLFSAIVLFVSPVICSGYPPDPGNSNIIDEYSDPDIIKADSLFSISKRDIALEYYKKAEKRLDQSDDNSGYVHVLNRIGNIMIVELGYDMTDAKKKLDKALEIGLNLPDIDSIRLAETYYCLGFFYDYSYDADKSEYYHLLSLEIRNLIPTRKLDLAESYRALGDLYRGKKELLLSEKYYIESRNMYEEEFDSNDQRLFFIYFKLYVLYRQKYYFNEADLYARKCIEICENTSLRDTYLFAIAYGCLANNFNEIEDYANAIPYYNLAIRNLIKLNGDREYYLSLYYENLSYAYLKQDSLELASKYLFKTQLLYNLDPNPDLRDLARLNMKWALYYIQSNDLDSALWNIENCIDLNKQINEDEKEWDGLVFETIWEYYYIQGKYDTALSILQKSLYDYVEGFDNPDIYSNPVGHNIEEMYPSVYDVIFQKARTFRNKYIYKSKQLDDLKTALELYHIANKLADDFRNSRMGESAVLFLNDYFRYDFEMGIDCAYRLYKLTADPKYLEDAFEFMERGKYMLLLESIRNAEKLTESDIPENLRKRKLEVEAEIANTNRLKDQELDKEYPDTVQINKWNQEQLLLSRDEEEIRKEFEVNYPGYLKIDYDNILIGLTEGRNLLPTNSSGIEYFYGDSAIYILGMTADAITFQKVKLTSEFDSVIRKLLGSFSYIPDSLFKISYDNYLESSSYLYDAILKPVINDLNIENSGQNEMLIVPDGLLSFVPFDALISSKPTYNIADYKGLDFLIKRYDIHYTYSLNFLNRSQLNGSRGKNIDLLAFSYSAGELSQESNGRSTGIHLPGTDVELDRISSSLKKKRSYYRGPDATETRFKELAASNNLLHLAIHGIADETNYLNSKLLFRAENDSLNDGFLYAPELYNMDLNHVKLTVLSACESGIGKNFAGEGTYSMARGFAYAGVPAIVMSLWNVDDMMTADLMGSFYKNLAMGKLIHQSLREAKLKFIENSDEYGAHPANWAAFVPMGNMDVVIKEKTNPLFYIGLVLIVVIISTLIIRRRKCG